MDAEPTAHSERDRSHRWPRSRSLGHPRHASRRLDVRRDGSGQRTVGRLRNRARTGRAQAERMDAGADDLCSPFWDAEEFGLDRIQRSTPKLRQANCARRPWSTSTPTCTCAAASTAAARRRCATSWCRCRRTCRTFDGGRIGLRRLARDRMAPSAPERRRHGRCGFEVELAALGSGADFVAFQDFLGLPTLQMEFDFEGSYGPYHSNYDTRRYVERFTRSGIRCRPHAHPGARAGGHALRERARAAVPLLALRRQDN